MNLPNIDLGALTDKIAEYAKKAGKVAAKPVLTLFYLLKDPNTPKKDKVIIYAALAYLLLPINFLSAKRFKLLGWADEATAIALTYKKMKDNISPEIEAQVDAKIREWFPETDTATE